MRANQSYSFLWTHSREIAYLASTAALLHWDQSTYIPAKGQRHRAEQLAFLAGIIHKRRTAPELGEALDEVEAALGSDRSSPEAANCREWRRDYDRAVRTPQSLAVAMAKAASLSETMWQDARPRNDWAGFMPHLEELLRLKLEEAEAVGYANEPYDALIDEFEPGETVASLDPLLTSLVDPIRTLLHKIEDCGRTPDTSLLHQPVSQETQEALLLSVLPALGLDTEASRLDSSAHPFSSQIGPGDVRLTTRYRADDFTESLYSAIHEMGHGLYDLGLPQEHWGTPLGTACSMGVHESQSRLWENLVGRSLGFWRHFLPLAARHIPQLEGATPEALAFAVNEAKPGLIRTDADQLTYNLHIILRFELERQLLRGELRVVDLPEAFRIKMRDYLGITPPDHAHGAMQDVHWAAGLFGYFPSYTLGNLYAAQLFQAAEDELGDLDEAFARGEFAPLLAWLGRTVHSQGMRLPPRELMAQITGQPPSAGPLMRRLESSLGRLYGL